MDAIIFDVDGTLWDSTDVVAIGYNRALQPYHTSVDGDRLKQLFGKTMDEIFSILTPGLSQEERAVLADDCIREEHIELEKTSGTPYPQLLETFEKLSAKYPLFIVSNAQEGYIPLMMRKTGLGPYIKGHLCFGETQTSKGQTILTLMKKHGLTSPVYVGDTLGDQAACKEAGVPFVFASYGFGDVKDPDYTISCLADLVTLF